MRALLLLFSLIAVSQANAYEHSVSPNRRFEAYTTADSPDGYCMKLFLRRAKTRDEGALLLRNDRWIAAKWSPDSHFLAVVDHPDGHIADVYVFDVAAAAGSAAPTATLLYHTPNPGTYDVQWEVVGWHVKRRELILRQDVRDQNAHTFATHRVTAKIGTEPLKMKLPIGT
jgi:hypothetical protein